MQLLLLWWVIIMSYWIIVLTKVLVMMTFRVFLSHGTGFYTLKNLYVLKMTKYLKIMTCCCTMMKNLLRLMIYDLWIMIFWLKQWLNICFIHNIGGNKLPWMRLCCHTLFYFVFKILLIGQDNVAKKTFLNRHKLYSIV